MSNKRVYVAYTGGTVGMRGNPGARAPAPGYLTERIASLPELESDEMPEVTVHAYEPLLDSANMAPENWLEIARDLEARYDDYDGFVVLHGTDTMAYTASALPFMLEGLAKPIVMTGSQIPLSEVRNDARENLIAALLIAGNHSIPEVTVLFGNRLMRGCRTKKIDASRLDAFASPNFPPLAVLGSRIDVRHDRVRPAPKSARLKVHEVGGPIVGALRLFPGMTTRFLENALSAPIQGLVLETFGVGNGPARDAAFLRALREATDRGVVVVGTTQCWRGEVDFETYATGQALSAAGVTSGGDMTAEAALAKLHYLLGQNLEPEAVRREVGRNLVGELTPPAASKAPLPSEGLRDVEGRVVADS